MVTVIFRACLILSIVIAASLLNACCNDPVHHDYTLEQLTLINFSYTGSPGNILVSSLPKEDTLEITTTYGFILGADYSTQIAAATIGSGPFLSTAYALQCNDDTYATANPITAIIISTLKTFDAEHAAKSDATELFSVEYSTTNKPQFTSATEYFKSMPEGMLSSIMLVRHHPYIYLTQSPAQPYQQFEIKVARANADTLKIITPVLHFQ